MGQQTLSRYPGSIQPNMYELTGTIEITAAGAILTQSGNRNCGATAVKNATAGRYDITLGRGYKRCFGAYANVMSPTAGNVPVVTDGNLAYVNGISAANMNGTSPTSSFTVQCCTSNGVATAANPKSGDFVNWAIWLSDSP